MFPNLSASLRALMPAVVLAAAPAIAQTFAIDCTSYGNNPPEPLGDRPNHALQLTTAACRVTGGVLDGAIFTQQMAWEVDGTTMTMLDGTNVYRKPGALAVGRFLSGTNNLIVEDGRTVGYSGTGKIQFVVASGAAAPYAGKTFTYKVGTRVPGRWAGEVTAD